MTYVNIKDKTEWVSLGVCAVGCELYLFVQLRVCPVLSTLVTSGRQGYTVGHMWQWTSNGLLLGVLVCVCYIVCVNIELAP